MPGKNFAEHSRPESKLRIKVRNTKKKKQETQKEEKRRKGKRGKREKKKNVYGNPFVRLHKCSHTQNYYSPKHLSQ